MGLYDNIICKYPLPGNPVVREWQTKDTPAQYLETYVITEDGRLMHEEYDTVDRSDPNATGAWRFIGCMARENQRLVPVPDFRGCIEFYGGNDSGQEWEFSVLFDEGKLLSMKQLYPPTDDAGEGGGT